MTCQSETDLSDTSIKIWNPQYELLSQARIETKFMPRVIIQPHSQKFKPAPLFHW
jgi:hypothetical protein